MNKQILDRPRYMVKIREQSPGVLTVGFVPRGLQDQAGSDGALAEVPQYLVDVHEEAGQVMFDWHGHHPSGSGTTQREFEEEAQARLTERKQWIDDVTGLIAEVEQWARALGWSTRRIEKRLDDSRIGRHKVPALVMQQDTARTILEPVSRVVPGGRGLAELSLMPSYADVASLYLRDDGWYVHYTFPRANMIAVVNEAETRQLSAEVVGLVLAGMEKHAG